MGAQDLIHPFIHARIHSTNSHVHDIHYIEKCLRSDLYLQSQLPGGQAVKDVRDCSSVCYRCSGEEYRVMWEYISRALNPELQRRHLNASTIYLKGIIQKLSLFSKLAEGEEGEMGSRNSFR